MKNLVLLHMESLSNAILKMNDDCFPNLNRWKANFECYPNYYSTATSTLMVITDLFFGSMECFESSDYLENIYDINCNKESIWGFLQRKGYDVKNFYYACNSEKEALKKLHSVIAFDCEYWIGDDEISFKNELSKKMMKNYPFAIFIEDDISHVGYKGERLNRESFDTTSWHKERYKKIDSTLGIVFDMLKEQDLLDDTVVIIYEDHGEEYWFHGLYEGYTHAIEPFTHIVHCPLMIFDGLKEYREKPELTATIDIPLIIKEKLGFAEQAGSKREYVFSRNLFAAQTKGADIFHKSYSVTDGEYTLLITRKGAALYINRLDPFSLTNLLTFYRFKRGRLVYQKKYDCMISSHYKQVINFREKQVIADKFEEFYSQMSAFLREQGYLKETFPLRRIAYNKTDIKWIKNGRWLKGLKMFIRERQKG